MGVMRKSVWLIWVIAIVLATAVTIGFVRMIGFEERVPVRSREQESVTVSPDPMTLVAKGRMTLEAGGTLDVELRPRRQEDWATGCDVIWLPVNGSVGILTNVQVYACGGSAPIFLGATDFDALSPSALRELDYSNPIMGEGRSARRRLHPGDVYAISTAEGNVAKLEVIRFGSELTLRYATYG